MRGDSCEKAVLAALSCDYTSIDTASVYANEDAIRRAIEGTPRDRLYITSKLAPNQHGYEEAKAACATILNRLQCGYLDLLLIHWPGVSRVGVHQQQNEKKRTETWMGMIELQKEGKVRDVGVSNFMRGHLEKLRARSEVVPVVNQIEIHPMLWEDETIQYCRENGIVLQAYSPLARGQKILLENEEIMRIGKKYGKSGAQVCIRWGIQEGFVVIPKSEKEERIRENINVFDFELSIEDMERIEGLRGRKLRTCWDPNTITK